MKILIVEGDSGTMVYCKRCGAIAGTPSKCSEYNSHTFVSTTVPVICKHCGTIPGKPTECSPFNPHSFIPVPDPEY